MKGTPSIQFYPSDWLRDPGLRACSLQARGLWMDMLAFMHEGHPYGHLRLADKDILPGVLARMVGEDLVIVEQCLLELEEAGVFSRTPPGTIFSRRLVRDHDVRLRRAQGGVESLKNTNVPRPKERVVAPKGHVEGYPSDHPSIGPSSPSMPPSLWGSPSSSYSSSFPKNKKVAVPASPETASPHRAGRKRRGMALANDAFIQILKSSPAYHGIDIDHELAKIDVWLQSPKGRGKHKTQQRIINWLNKIDRPLSPGCGQGSTLACQHRRRRTPTDPYFKTCGKPSLPNSTLCERCKAEVEAITSYQKEEAVL